MWFKKEVKPEAPVAIIEQDIEAQDISIPVAKPVSCDLEKSELEEYQQVAARIGLTGGAFLAERVRAFLLEENIHIYSPKEVWEFLNRKLGEGTWDLKGVRKVDVDYRANWIWHPVAGVNISYSDQLYAEAIPLPVLLTIDKIHSEFPDEAYFYVTSPRNTGDPFLLVSAGSRSFVVERWDEPDFRER